MSVNSEWIMRTKSVEREFLAAKWALETMIEETRQNPTILPPESERRDLRDALAQLNGTYVVRIFAILEMCFRDHWGNIGRTTEPIVKHLIDSIAKNNQLPTDLISKLQSLREYRNSLIHNTQIQASEFSVSEARSITARSISHLTKWK